MLDRQTQIRNSLTYVLLFAVKTLLPLVTIPIFTRILQPEDYGRLALALFFGTFMSGIANLGMSTAFDRNYFQYERDPIAINKLFYTSLAFVAANFLCLVGLAFVLREVISRLLIGSKEYAQLILWAMASKFATLILVDFCLAYLKDTGNAKSFFGYNILFVAGNFVVAVYFVVVRSVGVIGIVYAEFAAATGVVLLFVLKHMKAPQGLSKNLFLESVRIAYPLTPRVFLGVLGTQFDKYIVRLFATTAAVGVYDIGKRLSEGVFNFTTALQNVFNPEVYRRMFGAGVQGEGGRTVGPYLTPFFYVSTLVALCTALFSQEVVTILTPASYRGAIPIIMVLAMYFGLLFFGKVVGVQLIYSRKTHISSVLAALSVGLNVGINIPLISRFGAMGAAWGTLIASMVSGIIGMIVAQKCYKIDWEWTKIGLIIGVLVTSSIGVLALQHWEVNYVVIVCAKAVAVTVYVLVGIRFAILKRDTLRTVFEALKPKSGGRS